MSRTSLLSRLLTTKQPRPAEAVHLPVEEGEGPVVAPRTTIREVDLNVAVVDLTPDEEIISEAGGEAGGIGRRFVFE
jgi:hypothetical protein